MVMEANREAKESLKVGVMVAEVQEVQQKKEKVRQEEEEVAVEKMAKREAQVFDLTL